MPPAPHHRPVAFAVFAGCLFAYLLTLYPGVPGGDAGELIVAGHRLEVAHPPGYPLYTLLARFFSLLPLATVAWRVNLLSAVCAAAAAAVVYTVVVEAATGHEAKKGGNPAAAGIVAAGLFAFAPQTWLYAVTAEVFALHTLLVAFAFLLALRWSRSRRPADAGLLAIVLGLGLANHQTIVFYALPIGVWMLSTGGRELRRPRSLLALAGCGLLGISPYAWLWIAGHHATVLSWGDTSTVGGWLDHVLRRDYGTFQLAAEGLGDGPTFASQLGAWALHSATTTLGAGLGLAAMAATEAMLRPRRDSNHAPLASAASLATRSWTRLLVGCLALYVAAFHALANLPIDDPLLLGVLARFWQQADILVCILAGIGFASLAARFANGRSAATWTFAVLLVGARILAGVGERAHAGDGLVDRYGRALLSPLPRGAILLTRGDLVTNAVRYLQACEDLRPDVVVLDQELMTKQWFVERAARRYPTVTFPGRLYHPREAGGFAMRDFLDANRAKHEIYLYPEWKTGDDSTSGLYETWPMGLASRVLAVNRAPSPADTAPSPAEWMHSSAAALDALDAAPWPDIDRHEEGTWERVVLEDVWQAHHRRAVFLLALAIRRGDDLATLAAARAGFESVERSHPHPPWYLYKNLAMVYQRLAAATDPSQRNADASLRGTEPALRAAELAAWRRYLALAPPTEKDRRAIVEVVANLEASAREADRHRPSDEQP